MYHETYSRVLARKEIKMKTLAIVVLMSGVLYADQAADSFGTGFANALNQMLYGQQQQPSSSQPAPYQVSQPRQQLQIYPITGHYDIKDNYGANQGYTFESYRHCMNYVTNSGKPYGQCIWVGN
jgi:hypothetical protein